jgi:homogentisate 1,2-dioxygenase
VVGWQGDLAPYRLNVADFRPVVSPRYHLPPSVHTTFRCRGFDIATFAPRPFETEPGALRVPFYHSNIDNDELLFYHDGDFFSRKGIDRGMATLHPAGVHHGPQPGAAEGAAKKEMTDEVAVMVECLEPLQVSPEAEKASIEAPTPPPGPGAWGCWRSDPARDRAGAGARGPGAPGPVVVPSGWPWSWP